MPLPRLSRKVNNRGQKPQLALPAPEAKSKDSESRPMEVEVMVPPPEAPRERREPRFPGKELTTTLVSNNAQSG